MSGGFNDFSALKDLKKELQKQEQTAAPAKEAQPQRQHTVVHKSREQHAGEQKARELGLKPGSIVTLMDSNDRGILRDVLKDHVEIELDGLIIPAGFGDFIVNDPDEDRELMRRSGSTKPRKEVSPVQSNGAEAESQAPRDEDQRDPRGRGRNPERRSPQGNRRDLRRFMQLGPR